jgi:hypothetical protein
VEAVYHHERGFGVHISLINVFATTLTFSSATHPAYPYLVVSLAMNSQPQRDIDGVVLHGSLWMD